MAEYVSIFRPYLATLPAPCSRCHGQYRLAFKRGTGIGLVSAPLDACKVRSVRRRVMREAIAMVRAECDGHNGGSSRRRRPPTLHGLYRCQLSPSSPPPPFNFNGETGDGDGLPRTVVANRAKARQG